MSGGLLPIGVSFRGYVILRKIGAGGTGEVYLARHEVMGVDFAIKVIERVSVESDRESQTRFSLEARTAARIRHPALVAVHDAGFDEATELYFLVMDYLPGGTVADELRRVRRFSIKRALQIARTVVGGLAALERAGIVHRDVKPANMLMDAEGGVRLSDLGIVRDAAQPFGSVTQLGFSLGTPAYMPYEQIADSHAVDARADIYALGVSLFEMLTGVLPDGELSSTKLLKKRLDGERIPDIRTVNSAIPDWLAEIIVRMTEPDVEARWKSLDELKETLDARLAEFAPRRNTFAVKSVVKKRRLTELGLLAAGVLLGCLGLLIVGGFVFEKDLGRLLASSSREPEERSIRPVETVNQPQKSVGRSCESACEVVREVTNEVVRIVTITNEVVRNRVRPTAKPLPPKVPAVATAVVAAVSAPIVRPAGLTNVVEGVEIRGTTHMRKEIELISEMIGSMADTVRAAHGLSKDLPVQPLVRVVELQPGDGRYVFDSKTRIVRVGVGYGQFPTDICKMAKMCAGFMTVYTEGVADPFTAEADALVRDRALNAVLRFGNAEGKENVSDGSVFRRLLELESARSPTFLPSYYQIRREAYEKRKIVGPMSVHDFAAIVSLAAGENVSPYLRSKGVKVDAFATKVKARGLPKAEFFGE